MSTLDVNRLQEVFDAIDEDIESNEKITEWERDTFYPSVKQQYKRKGKLSEAQLDILERIYLKVR